MLKNKRKNHAVSEVFGTILLILISVTLFSVVQIAMFSIPAERSSPSVNIVVTIDGNGLILEHRGGQSLSLDTEVIVSSGSESTERISINDYLSDEYKIDGKWDIGERVIYPLDNLSNFNRFDPLDVLVVDFDSSSIVMMGTVEEARVADVKVEMSVSDVAPDIGQNIIFYITLSNQNGPSDAAGIIIKDILPGSLSYISNATSQGTYNSTTNIWDVGNLNVSSFATLQINATVISYGYNSQLTQLALILDEYGSITSDAWSIMKNGLAGAINDPNVFPHDGSVELTVVQFGVGLYCARVEVYPIVVNNNNYNSISSQISSITQGEGWTPMAAGIYLATDTLASSNNFGGFQPSHRQVINLVTDGNPNVVSEQGESCGDRFDGYPQGQAAAEDARYYLLYKLSMSEDQDEFDVVAVQGSQTININWLKDNIAWPQPGWVNWPPTSSGWVHQVNGYQEFVDSLDEQFSILFKRIDCSAELLSSTYMDPNTKNNEITISIYPNSQ